MASHKFRVGQVVGFDPSLRDGISAFVREYKILRLLPHEAGECSYRVKTITEAFERVAKEDELVLHQSLLKHTVTYASFPPWD